MERPEVHPRLAQDKDHKKLKIVNSIWTESGERRLNLD